MRFRKEGYGWKSVICGYCPCFISFQNEAIGYNLPCVCRSDSKCPGNQLRAYLSAGDERPSRTKFTEALLRTGAFTRKQIFTALQDFMKVKARKTAEWHLFYATHRLRDKGMRVRRIDGKYFLSES